jgi:uncharacterized protein
MKSRPVDPRHLDVEAFAKDGGSLSGEWPLPQLYRLVDARPIPMRVRSRRAGALAGRRRAARSARRPARRPGCTCAPTRGWRWCASAASGRCRCRCRPSAASCSSPARTRRPGLDADSEDDVLALTRALDLQELVEDELLLALPLVPRHEVCPQALPMSGRRRRCAGRRAAQPLCRARGAQARRLVRRPLSSGTRRRSC